MNNFVYHIESVLYRSRFTRVNIELKTGSGKYVLQGEILLYNVLHYRFVFFRKNLLRRYGIPQTFLFISADRMPYHGYDPLIIQGIDQQEGMYVILLHPVKPWPLSFFDQHMNYN